MESEEPVHRLARRRPAPSRASPRRATAGRRLKAKGLEFGVTFTSALKRAQRTLDLMLDESSARPACPITRDQALNERDYGDLSGLNKDDARAKWGEEQVHVWRRSYATAPPGGESLRDTGARVWPYYIHRHPAACHARRGRADRRPRQLAPRADHGARRADRPTRSSSSNSPPACPILYRLNADTSVAEKVELTG